MDSNYVERDGTKIGSSSNGTSPGNGFTDLIIPVDYRTTNASAEFGYSTPQYHFAVNYMISTFDSGFKTVTWNNPFWGNGIDTTYLSPDNDYQRLGLNGTIRQLPWNSTLAARFTWDRLESDTTLATTALNGTGASAFGATNPNVSDFNGKVENTTFSLAWSATPTNGLDTRALLQLPEARQRVDAGRVRSGGGARLRRTVRRTCCTPTSAGTSASTPTGGSRKASASAAGSSTCTRTRIARTTTRSRTPSSSSSTRTRWWTGWRRASSTRISIATRISCSATQGANANDVLFLERFIGRFDLQPVERHELKLNLDWTPSPMFDLSLEATWKDNDYKRSGSSIFYESPSPTDAFLGRTKDERQEIYISASFGDASKLRATAFYDIEWIRYDGFHRNIGRLVPGHHQRRQHGDQLLQPEHAAELGRLQLVVAQQGSQLAGRHRRRLAGAARTCC